MKYAVVEFNGKQFKVAPGDVINVEFTGDDSSVNFDKVLFVGGDTPQFGAPYLSNVAIKATVVGQMKGPKIRVAKFKAKSNYHNVQGYRTAFKQVKIESF
jgi:large subunit ribosomal protein L21